VSAQGSLAYESGAWEINLAWRELRLRGKPVPLSGRAFDIVEVLIQSAGEVVTKDDLMSRVWPSVTVEDNTLQVHVWAVRKALGADRWMLQTTRGRGYRLLGSWTIRHQEATRQPSGLQRISVSGESPATNFPATVTRLIGRSAAVAQLRDLISAYRVVTLTGPGGIGKTTLALKVARRVTGDFVDGGWLVELASLSNPALVPSTVAGVLRLELRSNKVLPEDIARIVADKKLLLVFDNCEHLIGAVTNLVETLLASCPYVTILTTSREVLRIQGERVYRVPPLDVPATEDMERAEILEHSAPELFITRARELGADLSTNTEYLAMISSICRHLDGIPLALELAAARAATLGIEYVTVGLRDRFELLGSGRRTALPRQRTLRAALDWSYRLLSGTEQELLNRLAIFAGPFSLDAASVMAREGVTVSEIIGVIADLVGKSLVCPSSDPLTTNFRLLETIRAYALDQLNESGDHDEIARRHACFFLERLAILDQARRSQPSHEYLAAFRSWADEIHVALEWAFSPAGDPTIGLALTTAAVPLWFELFQMAVARMRLEQALPHAEAGSDQEMRVRVALGHVLWYLAPESDAFEPNFARVAEIAERVGAITVRTQALWGMWAARRRRGDYPAALKVARQYADSAKSTSDLGAMHLGDRILGLTHHLLGHQPLAREFTERALRHPHDLDPRSGTSYQVETPVAMGAQLARILWLSGLPDQATIAAEEAVATAQQCGHSFPVAYAVAFAGLPVALWVGASEVARRHVDLLFAHATGDRRIELWGFYFASVLKLREGRPAETLIASRADITIVPPFGAPPPDADFPMPLSDKEPAQVLWNTPELLSINAKLLLWHDAPGAIAAAEAKLLRALEIARGQSALSWELRAAMSLARLWQRHGRGAQAHDLLIATYEKFTEGFGTSDLIRARSLIADLE
jgi:predicted ATPase/DNA-binding winged helix-turn-helix (wHTH) protein